MMRFARLLPASRSLYPTASSRFLSTQAFDGEMSELYSKVFAQHYNPGGPWKIMTEHVHAALPQGTGRVLDLATGPGEPGTMIAQALPNAEVLLTDFAPDMVEKAAALSKDYPNASTAQVDASDMAQFEDNSFDVVTCCYGYMFVPDMERAFSETLRVLKPGGTLVATYWVKLDMLPLCGAMMTAVTGQAPTPPPINPMSLSAPGKVEGLLASAGFVDTLYEESEYKFNMGADKELQFKALMLPIRPKLMELIEGGQKDVMEVAEQAFWKHVDTSTAFNIEADGSMEMGPNRFRLAVAKKSSTV